MRSACLLLLAPSLAIALAVGCSPVDDDAADHHGDEPAETTSSALVEADPVSSAVNQSCSTAVVKGLATQLVDEINCLRPNTTTKITGLPGVTLATGAQAVPFLQKPAVDAMLAAQKARGVTITINSGLRTLPQQYLLYRWYQTGRCGIGLAAKPGTSNHESAVAIDIADNAAWRTALTSRGFRWLGASDPVHYDFIGQGAVNLRGLSVKAFQRLWNRNHPEDRIDEDGAYGTETEKRLARAPIGGFPKGALASCNEDAGTDAGSLEPTDVPAVPDATEDDEPKAEPAAAASEPKNDDSNVSSGRTRSSGDSGGCSVSSTSSTEAGSIAVAGLALTIAFAAITRAALRRSSKKESARARRA